MRTWVRAYECTSFCTNVCIYICTYIRDPVRLRLRHLYHVEFCRFIVRYSTVGASVYCEHISSSDFLYKGICCGYSFELHKQVNAIQMSSHNRPASVAQLDVHSDCRPGGRGFNPRRGWQHPFVEIDHEIFLRSFSSFR